MSQAVLYDVQGPKARRLVLISSVVGGLVLLAVLGLAARRLAANGQFEYEKYEPFLTEPLLYERLLEGLQNTLTAAAYALVLALLLGVVLAFARLSHRLWISLPAVAVIEFCRGVPLLLLIFALFLGAPLVLGIDLPALWALVIGLTLYNGVVIAEIVRAGILAIPKGQSEAAMAIGLGRGQVLRLILLPQAVRIMLPSLVSQLVVLLKDTSLGFVIGFSELLRTGQQLVQFLNNPLQMYLAVGLVYITINACLTALAGWLERRQRRVGSPSVQQPVGEQMGQATL